jgi:hypothetical protein
MPTDSHAYRLFSHRRHQHSRAARHTSQISLANPTSSSTNPRRRTSLVASYLGRRHSQCNPTAHARPRARGPNKNVHFHLLEPRQSPHRQFPHTRLARERSQQETLESRAAEGRPICPQALLPQQSSQLFQQLPHIAPSPESLSRDFAATTASRLVQAASRFRSYYHTADATAQQVRELV